jgi:FAD/FMN-containing dehydrogenase
MKNFLLLSAAAAITFAQPFGNDEQSLGSRSEVVRRIAFTLDQRSEADSQQNECKVIASDPSFPTEAQWKEGLPAAKKLSKSGHTNYKIRVTKYSQVVDAVKFAAKYNIRLSTICSGHDFSGRNDAPSGLLVDTSLLRGISVHESFTPSAKGAEAPKMTANVIKPIAGKQAATTFGVGIVTQVLNNALSPSGLVTVGAAHGSVCTAGGYVCLKE